MTSPPAAGAEEEVFDVHTTREIWLLVIKALGYMDHTPNECSLMEWRDACDHFRTSFGAPIDGPECTCGMIKTALEVERVIYRNAAIPKQHREELLGEDPLTAGLGGCAK